MSIYEEPSALQADALGKLLFAGIPASEAIPFVAPLVDSASWPELIRRWPRCKPVMDVRVSLQGGPWTQLPDSQRLKLAKDFAHRCQAWALISQHPAELDAQGYSKWEKALISVEKADAGTSGKADAVTAFLEQFQRKIADGTVVVKGKALH